MWTSDLGTWPILRERDTSLAFVSRASTAEIQAVKQVRGCTTALVLLGGREFNVAAGFADLAQLSVFIHSDDSVTLTYVTRQRRDLE